jgi:hypothetical protein
MSGEIAPATIRWGRADVAKISGDFGGLEFVSCCGVRGKENFGFWDFGLLLPAFLIEKCFEWPSWASGARLRGAAGEVAHADLIDF